MRERAGGPALEQGTFQELVRAAVRGLLFDRYGVFGPTLACEELRDVHGITVSVETVRGLQIELAIWKPKRRKAGRSFKLRERRGRIGELIQIDGSPHDWFEVRGRVAH